MFENIKTLLLFTILTLLLMGVFGLIGSFFKIGFLGGILIGFVLSIAMNFGSYFYSDKIVLKMYGAKKVSEAPELHSIV